MKSLKYFSFFLLTVLFISACVKDKGNYAYTDLPDFLVDTAGTQTRFEVYQSQEKVTIQPEIVYNASPAELKGLWRLYVAAGVFDTLSRKLTIDTIITRPPGTYTLEFEATAPNGLKAMTQYTVVVLPPIPSGWMAAYEKNGATEVDIIRAPEFIAGVKDTVYRTVYSKINGAPLPGTPVSILYFSSALTFIMSSESGASVQNTDFRRAQTFQQLFTGAPPETVKPQALWPGTFNGGMLVNNGEVHWTTDNVYVGKITVDVAGYRAAPYIYTQFGKQGGFYDELNRRFITIEQQTSKAGTYANAAVAARFNLNNIGKDLLWIERGFGQHSASVNDPYKYAFFKDVSGTARYLYVINTQTPDRPDIAAVNISTAPEINDAKFYAVGNMGPAAFYATNRSLYNFQIDFNGNTISAPVKGFEVPAGEEITCLKLFKGQGTFGVNAILADDSKFMYVATWNATTSEAKIYMLGVNITSGQINSTPLKSWTVAGKVKDMGFKRS